MTAHHSPQPVGAVTGLMIHPIKSCAATSVESATVRTEGFAGDRDWQLVDPEGNGVTQLQHRELATVRPSIVDGGLSITIPGHGEISVRDPQQPDTVAKSYFGVEVLAADAGEEVARYFSDFLAEPVRLVRLTPQAQLTTPLHRNRSMSFAGTSPFQIVNTASVDALAADAAEDIPVDRFRANIVVTTDTPWVEDTWAELTLGSEAVATDTYPCARCAIPQINQHTGKRHKEPARALRHHRWCTDASTYPEVVATFLENQPLFGVLATIDPPGSIINVGDPVHVSATKPAVTFQR